MPIFNIRNVTLAFLLQLLQARLQNSPFYSLIELREYINEAISNYQVATLKWKGRFSALTTAGQVFYDLTSLAGTLDKNGNPQILMPLRVAFNGEPLDFCAIDDMDNGGLPSWQAQTTASPGAPNIPELWGTIGLNMAFIWPADAQGSQSLLIDAAVRAPVFAIDGSQDANTIDLDSGAISQLLDMAQHLSQYKRGTAMVKATLPKLKAFMKVISTENAFLAAQGEFRQAVAEQTDKKKRRVSEMSNVLTPARYR
jgi:hypothetical protein